MGYVPGSKKTPAAGHRSPCTREAIGSKEKRVLFSQSKGGGPMSYHRMMTEIQQ